MRRKSGFLFISIILLFFLASPGHLHAQKAAVGDLLVTNNTAHILVYARAINCFTVEMDAAIMAGVPTTFTFFIDLFQERSRWLDRKITRLTVRHTIKYDNVKKLFYVSIDGDKEPMSFQDFEIAKRAMSDLNGFSVAPLNTLKRNQYYYIEIKVKLDKVRLPLQMDQVFPFVSLWDFETDWHRKGFFY